MELELDLASERRRYEAGIRPSAEIGLLLLSRLERAEARVKLLESGIVSELVVTSVHSASAIGTTVSGISEDLLKLGYDGLAERLEKAEQAVARVRAMAQGWEANGNSCAVGDRSADVWHATANAILRALDGDARRLADDALGGGQDA